MTHKEKALGLNSYVVMNGQVAFFFIYLSKSLVNSKDSGYFWHTNTTF